MDRRAPVHASIIAAPIKLDTPLKVLLMIQAAHSCDFCGLTWLGVWRLAEETGLSERAVQRALKDLLGLGHLTEHRYGSGGRGRATEYIVLQHLRELSTAPCGKCQFFQKKGAPPAGFDKSKTAKPRTRDTLSTKPRTESPQKGDWRNDDSESRNPLETPQDKPGFDDENAPATSQQLRTNQSVDPREETRSGAATPPLSEPDPQPPKNATQARAQVEAVLKAHAARMSLNFDTAPRQAPATANSEGNGANRAPESEAVPEESPPQRND